MGMVATCHQQGWQWWSHKSQVMWGPVHAILLFLLREEMNHWQNATKRLQHRLDPGSGWTELSADSRAKGRVCIED
jgi:hypothetical protein